MNSMSSESTNVMAEMMDDESISIEGEVQEMDVNQTGSRTFLNRSSAGSTSSNGTTITSNTTASTGIKRQKDMPPCFVCGAKANGYNFDQITCESCKAFFRRNALKLTEKFRCRNNNNCVITVSTRKRCKRCRLSKCFQVGMRKEWILTEEEKIIKRQKIEQNRRIKKEAQKVLQHQSNQMLLNHAEIRPTFDQAVPHSRQSSIIPIPPIHLFHSPDRQLYERQNFLLNILSTGYFDLSKTYPQPMKFAYRKTVIAQTFDMDVKLVLIKDLTRELTQMTTLRLLNFFNLIPEFQTLSQQEKTSVLIQNMLAVFMFHGALTYDGENDTFVDRMTGDDSYDAKYLLLVYGPRVYHHFVRLARQLLSATSPCGSDKQTDENVHTLFLLLRIILLFSSDFQSHAVEHHQANLSQFKEKLNKIQMHYIEIACRFIHDQFGVAIGRRIFQKLVPLLLDLQKLCSTLANVNLCEMADDDDRSTSSSRHNTTTGNSTTFSHHQSAVPTLMNSSPEFHATMISGTSHLNELQKENRAPPPSISSSFSSSSSSSSSTTSSPSPLPLSSSPSILSNSSPSNVAAFRNNC